MNFLAILALPFLAVLPDLRPDSIAINVFSLFKPESLHMRVLSGDGSILDAAGLANKRSLAKGELIRIRLSGGRLNLVVGGSQGTMRQSVVTGAVRVVPGDSATVELILPGKIKRAVRGTVTVDAGIDGRGPLRIVVVTDRESAIASVVAAETSRREPAALMAIAVVVRTYMHSHEGRHSSEGFDFCDTTHCQLYRGEQDLTDRYDSPAVSRAVAVTAGQVLTFLGRPVEGFYTSTCGGLLATPSMVWGGSTSYPYSRIACRWCQHSRFSKWERSADAGKVFASLSAFLSTRLSPVAELITEGDRSSGFVNSVTIRDESRRTVLSTDAFRRAIGLRLGWNTVLSPTFTIERRGTKFVFRGRGFGSQVGLCEEGAVAQAAAGRGYREILNFYYPGAAITERVSHE
jgi:stage II sporulation protein D